MSLTPFAQKWVAALRSDKYKQGRGQLYVTTDAGEKLYCCLGVACDAAITEGIIGSFNGRHGTLARYPTVVGALGLRTDFGDYGESKLTDDNDDNGKSFAEIADIIESEPEGLFRAAEDAAA